MSDTHLVSEDKELGMRLSLPGMNSPLLSDTAYNQTSPRRLIDHPAISRHSRSNIELPELQDRNRGK